MLGGQILLSREEMLPIRTFWHGRLLNYFVIRYPRMTPRDVYTYKVRSREV